MVQLQDGCMDITSLQYRKTQERETVNKNMENIHGPIMTSKLKSHTKKEIERTAANLGIKYINDTAQ